MSGPDAAHILAVHPPVASPALEPLPISDQRSATSPHIPPVELYDANIDFYVGHLLKPEFLLQVLAAVAAETTAATMTEPTRLPSTSSRT